MQKLTDEQLLLKVTELKEDANIMSEIRSHYYDMTNKFLKREFDCELVLMAKTEFVTYSVFTINGIYLIVDDFDGGFLFHKMVRASRLVKEWFVGFPFEFEFSSSVDYFNDIQHFIYTFSINN
mgnify:CR=1 FL=1